MFGATLFAAAALITLLVYVVPPFSVARAFSDFDIYWNAGRLFLLGGTPYDLSIAAFRVEGAHTFIYPPPAATWFALFAFIPEALSSWIWSLLNLGLLLLAVSLILRHARPSAPWTWHAIAWLLTANFIPSYWQFFTGNISGLMAFLVAVVLVATHAGSRLSAVTLGVALKVYPILLLPAVLARDGLRGWRLAAIVASALTIPTLIIAPGSWFEFAQLVMRLSSADPVAANNLSIAAAAAHSSVAGPVHILSLASAAALVVASLWASRRGSSWWALAVGCATVAGLLVPNALWPHYALVAWPLAIVVLLDAPRLRLPLLVMTAVTMIATVMPVLIGAMTVHLWLALILVGLWMIARRGEHLAETAGTISSSNSTARDQAQSASVG